MKLTTTRISIFVASFAIQYFLLAPIMSHNITHINNTITKAYIAAIYGLVILIIDVILHDHKYGIISFKAYAIVSCLLILFMYLYRTQTGITDEEYLKLLIEDNSNILFISNKLLQKSNNYHIIKIAKDNIQSSNDEIIQINNLLKKKS